MSEMSEQERKALELQITRGDIIGSELEALGYVLDEEGNIVEEPGVEPAGESKDLDEDTSDDSEENESEETSDEEETEDDSTTENAVTEPEEDGDDEEEPARIPKSRLDKVIAQREAEKERVEWLEAQLEKALEIQTPEQQAVKELKEEAGGTEFDFVAAEEKYTDLLLAGETQQAAAVRAEITNQQMELIKSTLLASKEEATTTAKNETQAILEEVKFESAVESLEDQFPFLDVDSDQYNEEALDTVNTLMLGFMSNDDKISKMQALQKAVEKVVPFYNQQDQQDTKKVKSLKAKRKAIKASNTQPPTGGTSDLKDSGELTSLDIEKLSEKDFAKLSEKELAILRGDILG